MSEIKRVTLSDAPDDQTASSAKNVSASKSIRIEFKLFEPTADSFPEFNYKELYAAEKKQKKNVKKVNGFSDPFEENDDDVHRVAKEFERKYATCAGKRSSNNNDCDKGAGYDMNDGFIDNSEAYDELIPDEYEAVRGGFYINSGALEFKNLPNYERPEDAARMPKAKKRSLSNAESSSSGNEEPSRKPTSTKNGPNEKKPKLSDKDKHKNKEKKVKLKEKKDDGNGSDSEKDTKKVVKTTTVKDMLRAKRDSMRNMIDNGNKSEQTEDSNKDTSSSEDSSDSSDDGSDVEKKETSYVQNGDIKLPENLPTELLANIKRITEVSKVSSSGKNNFFDSNNVDLLYQIDTALRLKGGVVRNQVYNYLEKYLPCTKQTLQTRVKKARTQKEEAKTNKIVKKLQMAVSNVMSDLLNTYEVEYKRVSDLKAFSALTNGGKPEPPIKNPKKKFLWTDVTRNLLFDVINSRKQSFDVIKPRRETATDFINRFLSQHVLKIWPDGWMKLEELLEEFEKRQVNVKKPKENKKPAESTLHQLLPDLKSPAVETSSTVSSNTTSNSVTTTPSSLINDVKSYLSSTNSIVPNLKETSVTVIPSIKSEDKAMNSGAESSKTTTSPPSFGSNLTITPIGVNDKMTAKPLASVQNQVTITNVDSLSQPSKVLTTTPAITQHSNKPPIKDQPIVKSSSSSSSSNSGHTTNPNASKLTTKTPPLPADMLSPPKKATDHSINSIISSTAPINSHSNKNESTKLVDVPASSGTTRIINLDNLTTNDILSTAAASSETNIRIKSVETLNKSVPKNAISIPNVNKPANSVKDKDSASKKLHGGSSSQPTTSIQKPSTTTVSKPSITTDSVLKSTTASTTSSKGSHAVNQKSNFVNSKPNATVPHTPHLNIQKPVLDKPVSTLLTNQSVEEISSDSDDVEFVSETHVKKVKNPIPKVIKNIKTSNNSSRSSSPNSQAQSSLLSRRREPSLDGKDELDVKQIMEAIKELQEMQTNATGVHSSGSNSSHNKKSLHHSSTLPYNKKLDHLEHTSQLSKSSS